MKIGGLVVIGVLIVLLSRQQHMPFPLIVPPTDPPILKAEQAQNPSATGTIKGSLTYPEKSGANQAYVCAVNTQDHTSFCTEKIKTSYELVVPEGTYNVYASLADNPRDINAYRAYFAEADHTPRHVEIRANETLVGINPDDWSNKGDENIIAMINAHRTPYYPKTSTVTFTQPSTPASPEPVITEVVISEPSILDDKGGYSGEPGESHQDNN